MASIYGSSVANFSPNVLGTQELASSIQTAISNTTSKTGQDLVLETKSQNAVTIKANNTTVATFSANATTDPQVVVSGTSPDILLNSNSSETTYASMPALRMTNTNNSKGLFLGVPGSTGNPSLGTASTQFNFVTGNNIRMNINGYQLNLQNPTATIGLNWQNTLSNYNLNLPTSSGAKNSILGNSSTIGSLTFHRTPIVLYGAYLSDTTTGTTKEVVRSVTIPANTLSENSLLRVIMIFEKTGTRGAGTTSIDLDYNGSNSYVTVTAGGDTVLTTRLQYEAFMQNNLTSLQTLRSNNTNVNMGTSFNVLTVNHATNNIVVNVSITDPVAGCTTLRYLNILMT